MVEDEKCNSLGRDSPKKLTKDGVTTVSYTHLDVYKRQDEVIRRWTRGEFQRKIRRWTRGEFQREKMCIRDRT